jgi:hypothetical protein
LLCVTIVVNLATYAVSTLPNMHISREIAAVLPCGAVLAARALVPGRIGSPARARAVVTVAALAAVLPLEHYFGHPVAIHCVAGRKILIYRAHLLDRVGPPAR